MIKETILDIENLLGEFFDRTPDKEFVRQEVSRLTDEYHALKQQFPTADQDKRKLLVDRIQHIYAALLDLKPDYESK